MGLKGRVACPSAMGGSSAVTPSSGSCVPPCHHHSRLHIHPPVPFERAAPTLRLDPCPFNILGSITPSVSRPPLCAPPSPPTSPLFSPDRPFLSPSPPAATDYNHYRARLLAPTPTPPPTLTSAPARFRVDPASISDKKAKQVDKINHKSARNSSTRHPSSSHL